MQYSEKKTQISFVSMATDEDFEALKRKMSIYLAAISDIRQGIFFKNHFTRDI